MKPSHTGAASAFKTRGALVEEKLARTLGMPRHEYRAWLTEAHHNKRMERLNGVKA